LALPFAIEIGKFILKLLLPFIFSFGIAFILQPVVVFVQRFVKKRGLAVIIVVATFIGIITLLGYLITPHLIRELKVLIKNLPSILEDIESTVNNFADRLDFLPVDYRPTFENLNAFLQTRLLNLASLPNELLDKFFAYSGLLVVIPMTIIYFLIDYEKILCGLRNYLTEKGKIHLKDYLGELHQVIASYIRGTFLVMVILVFVCTALFLFLDLDFAIFFAIIIAITNIIPYLGPYLGAIFPVLYALIISPAKALMVALAIFLVQQVESNFLTPYINSKRIKTHPLIGILFLLFFGNLFGIIGMIFATPVLAVIRITLKYYNPFTKKTV
jgi:predicted PurR-regulated permease PerM